MNERGQPSWRWLTWSARALAAGFAAVGVAAMLLLAPRVPYADSWRFVASMLTRGFPGNVIGADNGHREVLPNAVRVADLTWCDGDQLLQIAFGATAALVVLAGAWWALRTRPEPARSLAAAAIAIGLFWLGNGRKLAHGSESVSQFLVLGWLLAGLALLAPTGERPVAARRCWLAAACGLLAALSFGSGVACFPAFAAVLLLQRAPFVRFVPLLLGAGAAVALVLGADRAPAAPFQLALGERVDLLLRWLGAPSTWAFSPALDVEHAARLPGAARTLAQPIADVVQGAFGPRLAARWPAAAFGAAGLVWLAVASVRAFRRPANALERGALGAAWFGLAVGALVVGLRVVYFRYNPDQITTLRYVPWAMLMWTGLVVAHTARARSPWRAAWPVLLFAALLAPSTIWLTRQAWHLRETAELTALGAAVGVIGADFDLSETRPDDLAGALPLLAQHGKAMYAWPETPWLQRVPPAGTAVAIEQVAVRPVTNRFAGPGAAITFHADADAPRLLLVGADGTAIGLALRLPLARVWQGFVRGAPDARELRALALPPR